MTDLRFTRDDIVEALARAHACKREVGERLQWLLYFTECQSVSKTCRRFGIARSTFYRWAQRFDATNLHTLEDQPTNKKLVVALSSKAKGWEDEERWDEGGSCDPSVIHQCFFCKLKNAMQFKFQPLLALSMITNLVLVLALMGIVFIGGRLVGEQRFYVSPASAFEHPTLQETIEND